MEKFKVAEGVHIVNIPEAGLSILCGCPENIVKHLIKDGYITMVEKDGVRYETGPNAILLSETPIQNGKFSNLSEFPVLQMLYRQGMIIPRHPNNTGVKPMLIGLREQVEAQSKYIMAGNYGLGSAAEIAGGDVSPEEAEKIFRMKLKFAFGRFLKTEELLELKIIDKDAVELRNNAFIYRNGPNAYEFLHEGKSVSVDLNLGRRESYRAPYVLPFRKVEPSEFCVVHTGEGDGWDPERPCMGSIIYSRGKPFLVDMGPDLGETLRAFGITVNDIGGVFITHIHDDHFVGLTELLRADRRIAFYAVRPVMKSVVKKLCALTSIKESSFRKYFDPHFLDFEKWADADGFQVMPILSPHPVETSIFIFRAGEGGKTYAHFADIVSFKVLDSMVVSDPKAPGISAEYAKQVKGIYLQKADIKKLDIGGGMIHGNAEDFAGDPSGKIFLSHTSRLSESQLKVGNRAEFGETNVLVPGLPVTPEERAPLRGMPADPDILDFLRNTELFGNSITDERLEELALAGEALVCLEGESPDLRESGELYLVNHGKIFLYAENRKLETVGPGSFFGEDKILFDFPCIMKFVAGKDSLLLRIPGKLVESIPVALWRLKEIFQRRMNEIGTVFSLKWKEEYAVNIARIDEAHRGLFEMIEAIRLMLEKRMPKEETSVPLQAYRDFAWRHCEEERKLMEEYAYPDRECHAREHEELFADFDWFIGKLDESDYITVRLIEFLKNWIIRHTLLTDRQYMRFFWEKGIK